MIKFCKEFNEIIWYTEGLHPLGEKVVLELAFLPNNVIYPKQKYVDLIDT